LGVLVAFLLIFFSGVGAGVYYHTEISVLARHYLGVEIVNPASTPLTQEAPPPTDAHSFVVLPKLEAPLPLVYSETLEENQIQEDLKRGAVVLPLGTTFGEAGNVVVTAHSSGSAAFGPYRSAFAKLSEINEGEEFSVTTPTGTYTYRVFGKEIVWPHQVDHLPQDDRSTVTLVTCWPLWTNFKRLLVHSELIKTEPVTAVQ
jgi:sortase A